MRVNGQLHVAICTPRECTIDLPFFTVANDTIFDTAHQLAVYHIAVRLGSIRIVPQAFAVGKRHFCVSTVSECEMYVGIGFLLVVYEDGSFGVGRNSNGCWSVEECFG